MKIFMHILISISFLIPYYSYSQIKILKNQIEFYLNTKEAITGVAVWQFETGDTFTIGNQLHYPMQSVYKFHLALAILHQVDEGKFLLTQKFLIHKKDLRSDTWSPLQKKYPEGNVELPLSELIVYMISESDNNACDFLFKLIGGALKVENYMHSLGLNAVSIKATEYEMHKNLDSQYTNWTTPFAAVQLLRKFYLESILSKNSFDFLLETMTKSSNSTDRLKGQLPENTIVAHKTGTSFRNSKGIKAATNDIGIIRLPNGQHFAIAVFVSDANENDETCANMIAHISKMCRDYFLMKAH